MDRNKKIRLFFALGIFILMVLPTANSMKINTEKYKSVKIQYVNELVYKPYHLGIPMDEDVVYYWPDHIIIIFNDKFDVNKEKNFKGYNFTDINPELNAALLYIPNASTDFLLEIIEELSKEEEVEYVNLNVVDDIYLSDESSHNVNKTWGQKIIKCPEAWKITKGDKEVSIAFVDTGVDYHEDFKKPEKERDFTKIGEIDLRAEDIVGHGTKMVGIVFGKHNDIGIDGIAPNCTYYSVRVTIDGDIETRVDVWRVARGICYASSPLHLNADILCIPIAVYLNESFCYPIKLACRIARDIHHSVLIAPAGNKNGDILGFPGKYTTTVCVGAINSKKELVYSKQKGVDIVAPGHGICTTNLSNSYEYIEGSSPATAFVAGVAALYFSSKGIKDPSLKNVENCEKALFENAIDLGEPGEDKKFGNGLVNAYDTTVFGCNIVNDFTWSPHSPSVGEKVTFVSKSYDPDGTITNYAWDFENDGEDDAHRRTVTTTFLKPGTYTCAHWVKSSDGQGKTVRKTITVKKTRAYQIDARVIQPVFLNRLLNFFFT